MIIIFWNSISRVTKLLPLVTKLRKMCDAGGIVGHHTTINIKSEEEEEEEEEEERKKCVTVASDSTLHIVGDKCHRPRVNITECSQSIAQTENPDCFHAYGMLSSYKPEHSAAGMRDPLSGSRGGPGWNCSGPAPGSC